MQRKGDELSITLSQFPDIRPDPRAMEQVIHLMMAEVAGQVTTPVAEMERQAAFPTSQAAAALPPQAAADAAGERLFRLLTLLFGLLVMAAGLTWQMWLYWLLAHKAVWIGLMLIGSLSLITPLLLLPALKDESACVREGGSVIC